MEAEITSQAVGLTSTDFSIFKLFLRADIIVKSVILILIAASIFSWAIIIDKHKLFKKINKSSEEFEDKFWKSKSAETFFNSMPANLDDPMAKVFRGTMQSVIKVRSRSNLSERLNSTLQSNIEKGAEILDGAPEIYRGDLALGAIYEDRPAGSGEGDYARVVFAKVESEEAVTNFLKEKIFPIYKEAEGMRDVVSGRVRGEA